MKKRMLAIAMAGMLGVSVLSGCGGAKTDTGAATDNAAKESEVVANKMFQITMPAETAGTYVAETTDNSISIYDKEAKEADFGGFAFDVSIYEDPSGYVGDMTKKVGEFTDKDGKLYDVVISYPSDVQYDYTKNENGAPESYRRLYDGAEDIIKTLDGVDGGTFSLGAGTKGEDLYGEQLQTIVTAVTEGWDANKLKEAGLSPIYATIAEDGGDVKASVGYVYADVNADGVEELLVGEIAEGDKKGAVYDVFTMVDRKPAHVVSGVDGSCWYALDPSGLVNEYSPSDTESGWSTYALGSNSVELVLQQMFKTDNNAEADKRYFVSYDEGATWEPMTEKDFNEQKEYFGNYTRFDFSPLP